MFNYGMLIPFAFSLPFALVFILPTPDALKSISEAIIAVTLSFNLYINYKMKLEAIDVKNKLDVTTKANETKLDTLTEVAGKVHTAVNGSKEVILRQSQTSAEANLASTKALYELQPNAENKQKYEAAQAAVQAAAVLVTQHVQEQEKVQQQLAANVTTSPTPTA